MLEKSPRTPEERPTKGPLCPWNVPYLSSQSELDFGESPGQPPATSSSLGTSAARASGPGPRPWPSFIPREVKKFLSGTQPVKEGPPWPASAYILPRQGAHHSSRADHLPTLPKAQPKSVCQKLPPRCQLSQSPLTKGTLLASKDGRNPRIFPSSSQASSFPSSHLTGCILGPWLPQSWQRASAGASPSPGTGLPTSGAQDGQVLPCSLAPPGGARLWWARRRAFSAVLAGSIQPLTS